ncbi:hypothetical protein CDL12_05038 [Handroanthus impetiginosus]|uniref:RNase H type-1 domain-containing protein n=1 Tax=Handroanthus impetiginosus TaxID=429701 RepID=A0A2G9HY36_9LAMI|nr:hypothetical protein CDL12_05038 [Handroanthus impetiginosus]
MELSHTLQKCHFAGQTWVLSNLPHSSISRPDRYPNSWFLDSFKPTFKVEEHGLNSVGPSRWRPPECGSIKINFDAGVFGEEHLIGIGIIARDSGGRFIAWRTKVLTTTVHAETAEALAAREAAILRKEMRWKKLVSEGDNSTVVVALNSDPVASFKI